MKHSIIATTLLFRVDTRDYFGFALNDAINRFVANKIKNHPVDINEMVQKKRRHLE